MILNHSCHRVKVVLPLKTGENAMSFAGNPTTLGETIRKLRKMTGLSQKQLAAMLGVDQSTIAYWESGKNFPRHKYLERMAAIFGVSPAVFYVNGDEFRKYVRVGERGDLYLPVVSYVHAGLGVFNEPEELLMVTLEEARKAHYVMKVKGRSMEPTLFEGDYIGVRQQSIATTGDIVVALVDEFDEVTVKRLKQVATEIILVPDNPEFPSYSSKEHRIRIIGKVTWIKRFFER
jgi:SOS-response transcriptional repressor LexA